MNSDPLAAETVDRLPERFARRFLENRGAILEKCAVGYDAALPAELAAEFEVPDLIRLVTADRGADTDTAGDVPACGIHYGAALLDRMVALACRDIPLLTWDLHFDYIKREGFDKLIARQFSFPNAVGVLGSQAAVRTHYLLITCRYLAQSDEQKEGLVTLAFNLETGACVPDMAEAIGAADRRPARDNPAGGYDAAHVNRVLQLATTLLEGCVTEELAEFTASMQRRFRRDAGNLTDYYRSLAAEMRKSLERPGLSQDLIADRQAKIRLIPDELARKQDDLLKKYSIRISVQPGTVLLVRTAAVKLLYRLSIGKSSKTLSLIYNPVTKAIDPLVCEGCGMPTFSGTACDRSHLLCRECVRHCPVCHPPGGRA